ncbi:Kelch repeat-containing protein [Compostibacter hankyongensis]|uniref:Kelch repeat-containing protein n=1 Tax=Compostibacter hankyongensis TaxID=1007089 RepID=A0ABP8FKX2_9BACT
MAGIAGCSKNSDSDSTLGNWIKRSDFDGYARNDAASFVVNGKAYVGTGFDGKNRLKDCWEYNPDQNAWTQKADFPGEARNGAVGFSADNRGYIATGYNGVDYLKDCWQYDPEKNVWARVSDFGGTARHAAVAFGIGSKGYITCGYDGRYLKDFWEYDPASDKWTQKASMGGSKRMYATAFVIKDMAYIFGGVNNGSLVNDFWAYDPAQDKWTQKRDITNTSDDSYDDDYTTIVRGRAAAFVIDDTAYIATGETPSLISNVWEYDPKTDLWIERTAFQGTPRVGATGFAVKNRGFIAVGGTDGTTQYDDLWEFQPYVEDDSND